VPYIGYEITDLTLTFVESRYPRKLLAHLRQIRGFTVAEKSLGIYTVIGDILPIQIINSRKLVMEENIWLKGLGNRLDIPYIRRVMDEIMQQDKDARIRAYLGVITRANKALFKEAFNMHDPVTYIAETFADTKVAEKWKAIGETVGEERKAFDIARNLISLGLPPETVVSATGLDLDKVQSLKLMQN